MPWAHPDPELVRDGADAARRAAGRPSRLPRRRHGAAAAAARRPERDAGRRARAGAARVAAGGAPVLERSRAGSGRVDPAAARAARRGARGAAARAAPARARRRVEAHAGADRRGRARRCSARSPCAVAGDTPQRTMLGWLLDRCGCARASLTEAEQAAREASHPALVRAPVPGRRRRHDREGGRARGGGRGARRREAARRDRRSDDRPLQASAARGRRRGRRSATAASWPGATQPARRVEGHARIALSCVQKAGLKMREGSVHDGRMPSRICHDRVMDWHDELMRIAPRLQRDARSRPRRRCTPWSRSFLREDAGIADLPRFARAASVARSRSREHELRAAKERHGARPRRSLTVASQTCVVRRRARAGPRSAIDAFADAPHEVRLQLDRREPGAPSGRLSRKP